MDQNVKKYKFYCLDTQHCTFSYFADIENICNVSEHLKYLNKAELKNLGRLLGLSHATISNHFDDEQAVYLSSIVEAWLLKKDKVAEKGGTSWSTLEAALRHKLLGHNGIADNIRREQITNH